LGDSFSIRRWLTTTNHKDIGVLYIVTSLYFMALGGALALLMRLQLATPDNFFLEAAKYNQAVTIHGLLMVLWVVSPMAFGFANYFVPIQIGARDMAFPRLNAMSYWLYLFSGIMAAATFFLPGGAPDTGWTVYAPLNTARYTPQPGMTLGGLALLTLIFSVTLSTINFVVTIIGLRAPGMKWSRLPMFVWSILYTVIMMLFAFPSLAVGILLLASDRVLATTFFTSIEGGDLLWEHLFWFFGHPEVYIVLTPAIGIVADIVSVHARRPLYGRKYILAALLAATLISFLVWVHHMFTTGINPVVRKIFSATTIAISLPFEIVTIYLLATLVRGVIRYRTALLFALGAIAVFIIGGISGVYNASIALNYHIRGTYWVVAHFHYVMAGTVLFALFAALYYWFPKMTGRLMSEKIGKIHFILSFIGFNILYFPMFLILDMPRRVYTYPAELGWALPNSIATIGSFIFSFSQILLVVNLLASLSRGPPAGPNPWDAWTLEWMIDSPPPRHNFDVIPDLTKGFYTIPNGAGQTAHTHQEHFTPWPMAISLGVALLFTGLVVAQPLAILGLVVFAISILAWLRDDLHDRFRVPEEERGERWPLLGLSKDRIGVWTFLAGELMLFGALISSYLFIRAKNPNFILSFLALCGLAPKTFLEGIGATPWPVGPEVHNIWIGAANTIILLTSSLTMILALEGARRGDRGGLIGGLLATLTLGATFLAVKGFEWLELVAEGFTLESGLPAATFYITTGAHGAHVLAGLLAITYLTVKALKGRITQERHEGVEHVGLYWHLVDIVWVFLFPLFYLL
jgi:cytochrome c oxidase subunit I+III